MELATPRIPFAALLSLVLLTVGAFAFAGCLQKSAASRSEPAQETQAQPAGVIPASLPLVPAGRALVITVTSQIEVDDVEASVDRLRKAVAGRGGYVAGSTQSGEEEARSAQLEVRVPSDKLDAFRSDLRGLGEPTSETEHVEDVTEQRADLGARLRNARAQEARLLSLLAEKSANLADVIAVEKELGSVRESIERMEAQQRGLDGKIQLATLNISLRPKTVAVWKHPIASIGNAVVNGLHHAWTLVVGLCVVAATVLPSIAALLLIFSCVFFPVRMLSRRRQGARA